jgi:hypothetical protein
MKFIRTIGASVLKAQNGCIKKIKGIAAVDNLLKMFKFIQKLDKIMIFIFCVRLDSPTDKVITLFNKSHHAQTLTAQTISTKFFNLRRVIHADLLYRESI